MLVGSLYLHYFSFCSWNNLSFLLQNAVGQGRHLRSNSALHLFLAKCTYCSSGNGCFSVILLRK